MNNLILIFAFLLVSLSSVFGQDIIELKSGESIDVRITMIGQEFIEFRPYNSKDEAVIKIDKFLVKAYKFESADSKTAILAEKVTNIKAKDLYDQRKFFAIKTQPIQFLGGNFKLSYEESFSYNTSAEVEIGIRTTPIAFEYDTDRPMTFHAAFRYKSFYRPSSLKMTDTGRNPLQGLYIAPVVSFGSSENFEGVFEGASNSKNMNHFAAGMIDVGYQFVVNKAIVDSFIGMGMSVNSKNSELSMNTSHTALSYAAVRLGFRMGLNFPK